MKIKVTASIQFGTEIHFRIGNSNGSFLLSHRKIRAPTTWRKVKIAQDKQTHSQNYGKRKEITAVMLDYRSLFSLDFIHVTFAFFLLSGVKPKPGPHIIQKTHKY